MGVGVSAVAVGAAVSGLSGPASGSTTIAVPAPVVSVSQPAAVSPAVEAERAARQAELDRSAAREQLSATAVAQAGKRSAALADQSRSITRQQAKIVADRKAEAAAAKARAARAKARAAAAAKAAAAREAVREKARKERIKAQGYEPGTTDPRAMARQILQNKFGYGADQFSCFNNIIIRESNWDVHATNASSGAYGIPQALPGTKMASVGSDWRTNPATQIIWGIGYMKDRYGSPCAAWGFKSSHGWY